MWMVPSVNGGIIVQDYLQRLHPTATLTVPFAIRHHLRQGSPQQSECVKMVRPQLHWETDETAFFPVKKFDIPTIIDSIGCRLESTWVLGSPIVALDSFRSLSQSLPCTVSVLQTLLRFLTAYTSRTIWLPRALLFPLCLHFLSIFRHLLWNPSFSNSSALLFKMVN